MKRLITSLAAILLLIGLNPGGAPAVELSKGAAVYVPIYTHFYQSYGKDKESISLTNTVVFHNTDPKKEVTVTAVEFYDADGKFIKNHIPGPISFKPFSSKELILKISEPEKKSGANVVVRWKAEEPVNPPIVEVLMVGFMQHRGISFLTRGQEIKE